MIDPPRWTETELQMDSQTALDVFRHERVLEPLELYGEEFEKCQSLLEDLLEGSIDLTGIEDDSLTIVSDREILDIFRYLAGPPISLDDLLVVSEVKSVARTVLEGEPEIARKVVKTVMSIIDRRRFPWVFEEREPTEAERQAAILASAALAASQKVATARRSESNRSQETRVKEALKGVGFREVETRRIPTLASAPAPGTFCGESELGKRKADLVVRLWDGRIMPIECKVSNSYTNSIKRLNNDAAAKAHAWTEDFGRLNVVPTAILSGAFKVRNLQDAQERGLALFWSHALQHLTLWIGKTRVR